MPEDRTEERGGQEHDHHHQSVAQVCTQGGGYECRYSDKKDVLHTDIKNTKYFLAF